MEHSDHSFTWNKIEGQGAHCSNCTESVASPELELRTLSFPVLYSFIVWVFINLYKMCFFTFLSYFFVLFILSRYSILTFFFIIIIILIIFISLFCFLALFFSWHTALVLVLGYVFLLVLILIVWFHFWVLLFVSLFSCFCFLWLCFCFSYMCVFPGFCFVIQFKCSGFYIPSLSDILW